MHLILPAHDPPLLHAARDLMIEYARSIAVIAACSLQHQGFDAEMAALPGKYAPPAGAILLALDPASRAPLGVIALRPLPALGAHVCEMKRLYVRPAARAAGAGRALCEALIASARVAGYTLMKLDTAPQLAAATRLYQRLGFTPCDPYNDDPDPHTLWMHRQL